MSEQHPYRHPYVPSGTDRACASCGWRPAAVRHGRRERAGKHRVPECNCGATGVRDDDFDAYYCPASGVWLEERCHESERCSFCNGRPEKRAV